MQPSEQVMYYVGDKIAFLKLKGSLRFTCTPYLDVACKNIKIESNQEVIFDLTETKYIDSTIIGIIAKLFLKNEIRQNINKLKLSIVYKDEDVKQLFNKIGFDQFFTFLNEEPRLKQIQNNWIGFSKSKEDIEDLKKFILEAHETLNKIQPNDPAYNEVVQSLKDR